jgi:hypothetical protein
MLHYLKETFTWSECKSQIPLKSVLNLYASSRQNSDQLLFDTLKINLKSFWPMWSWNCIGLENSKTSHDESITSLTTVYFRQKNLREWHIYNYSDLIANQEEKGRTAGASAAATGISLTKSENAKRSSLVGEGGIPCSSEAGDVGLIPANSDAQNAPCFRRWQFEMKLRLLSPFFGSRGRGGRSNRPQRPDA